MTNTIEFIAGVNMKELFYKLFDPDIKKIDYDAITLAVNLKALQIWQYICNRSDRYCDEESTFEIKDQFIKVVGESCPFITTVGDFDTEDNSYYPYNEGFPVELLWEEEWKSIVVRNIDYAIEKYTDERLKKLEQNKVKKAAKKTAKKDRLKKEQELRQSILLKTESILTKEEFNFLKINI